MKKALFTFLSIFLLGTIVFAATGKVLYSACVLINSGASSSISNLKANTNYAWIYMKVNKAYSTSKPKKSRVRVYRQDTNNRYKRVVEKTFTNITSQTTNARIGQVPAGTWKIAQYQYDSDDEPFIGIDADISYSCGN